MAYLNHNIPPFSAYIRNEYLFNHTKGHGDFTFADVHTVNCMERRAILFECLLPNGVNWTRRPINAFVWKKEYEGNMSLEELELWDGFDYHISIIRKDNNGSGKCKYLAPSKNWYHGDYLFTVDSAHEEPNIIDCGYSEYPEQHITKMQEGGFGTARYCQHEFDYNHVTPLWRDFAAYHSSKQYKDEVFVLPINIFSKDKAKEIRIQANLSIIINIGYFFSINFYT